MSNHEFCPCCGIGLNNIERKLQFCNNCRTDFKSHDEEQEPIYNQEYHLWREGEYLGTATYMHDENIGDAFVKQIVTEKGEIASEVYNADKWESIN